MPSYSFAGSKNSPYLRLLPPAYGDGVFLPRYFHLSRRVSSKLSFYFFRGVSLPPNREQGYQSSLPSPRLITDTIMRETLLKSFLSMSIVSPGRASRTTLRARQTPTW